MIVNASMLNTTPVPEAIEGVFPQVGVATVWGPSGKGKSLVMNVAALAMSNGLPFLGRPTIQGTGVFCIGEGHSDIGLRLQAMQYAAAWAGVRLSVAGIRIDDEVFPLRSDGHLNLAMARWEHDALGFVILDALSYFGNTDNAQSAVGMMTGAQRIAEELGILVILIHHADRTGGRFRGAQALFDMSDAFLHLDDGVLTVEKQKAGPVAPPLSFGIEKVSWADPQTGAEVRSAIVRAIATPADCEELDPLAEGALGAHMSRFITGKVVAGAISPYEAAAIGYEPSPPEAAPGGPAMPVAVPPGTPELTVVSKGRADRRSWVRQVPVGPLAIAGAT
jgi:hypothetical protein